ncbi:hypothetical protein FL966_04365 [Caproiciproducens galactitolivorans]|uniref:Uncharacterized protein n=1 Tax=Caproiciproducens galactitolivorans TaxID=642589 RepID=A0A4Z0YGM2_9FIRM|nr:hypothetical protein [Caproiciproducens galactitolivorans]QEY34350.1 hypothetical protein FL966_04365 [Caproiciproducens galactitolivorans]TGJ77883.1 hypothetical protein CAGA_02920 [Caproiciproducens galactitolivorans]
MVIKNVNSKLNYISSPYIGKKTEKADALQSSINSSFSNELNKATNAHKVDTINLSKRKTANIPSLSDTRDKIISDLKTDKDPKYLEYLKVQISSNQYDLNPFELAKTMLINGTENN